MYIDPPKPGRHLSRTGFGFAATLPHHDPDAVRVQRALMSDHRRELEDEINRRVDRRERITDAIVVFGVAGAMLAGIYAEEIGRILAPFLGVA